MKRRVMMGKKKLQLFTKRFFPAGQYTWIVPAGCYSVDVFLVGAGGGTKGIVNWGSSGGGGGGYTKTFKKDTSGWRDGSAILVTPGQSIQIIVGAGVSGANGGYSQFMNSNYRANGGNAANRWGKGADGGSGGGGHGNNAVGNGGSDGGNGYGSYGKGQGHTTRDFGEQTGKRNAGGGSSINRNGYTVYPGESDYKQGCGESPTYTPESGFDNGKGGGGYGGGAGPSAEKENIHTTKGGDGTVLIRYWAYEE